MHSINEKPAILLLSSQLALLKRPIRPEAPRTTLLYSLYSSVKDGS